MNNHEYSWTKGDNHSDMQNPKQINHSHPSLKLYNHEYSLHLDQYLMGDNYTKSNKFNWSYPPQ